jgi:molybdopterin-guanine dinucleotide biosynthesis protein A
MKLPEDDTTMKQTPFSAMLLAGGRSRRMGIDKALLDWNGEALWQAQVRKLKALQPQRLIISCREDQNLQLNADLPGVEWIYDPHNDERGPLGAIQRTLDICQMPLVVLAVDMPCMTADFLKSEILAMTGRGRCIASKHGLEPLAALYVPAMLPLLNEVLAAGQRSLQSFLKLCELSSLLEVREASEVEEHFFANVNTVSEWLHEKGRCVKPA